MPGWVWFTFEKRRWLEQRTLQDIEEMHIELLCLADIFPYTIQQDHLDNALSNILLSRYEDPGARISGGRWSVPSGMYNRQAGWIEADWLTWNAVSYLPAWSAHGKQKLWVLGLV